jgi:hypothetical protein
MIGRGIEESGLLTTDGTDFTDGKGNLTAEHAEYADREKAV